MTTAHQLTANARKSNGSGTEQGKQRTRLNAYRHGLTGQIRLLTAQQRQALDQHCTGIRDALEPVSTLELDLEQTIAEDRWRLKRARALETGIVALGQLGAAPDRDDPAQLPIDEALSQNRTWLAKGIHRTIERNMAQLRTLRAERKAARQPALEKAQLLAQLAYSKSEKYDPASGFPPEMLQIGSDFSRAGEPPDRPESTPGEAAWCGPMGWPMCLPGSRPRNPSRVNEKAEA